MRALTLALSVVIVGQPVFKSGVDLVTVPITVTNAARDQLITAGLGAADFRLFEDGVEQRITLFSQERRPVSICFVVDASGSMAQSRRVDNGVRALRTTVEGLDDLDEIAIVRFASSVLTTVPWTRRRDPSVLEWRVDGGAGTAPNSSVADAVKAALTEIEGAAHARRVIVIISDGYENASATPLSSVARTREQSEAVLYGFGMFGPYERAPGGSLLRNILPELVGETGGVYWNVSTPTEAEFAATSLLNELKYQMTLGYTPAKPFDGKYRRLKVETTVQGLAVRHRGGYLAQPSSR
jgi:VWFA-related protein